MGLSSLSLLAVVSCWTVFPFTSLSLEVPGVPVEKYVVMVNVKVMHCCDGNWHGKYVRATEIMSGKCNFMMENGIRNRQIFS